MINIRKAQLEDITSIISIHKEIFDKDHFTSHFPDNILVKYFYKLISKNTFNYVAYNQDKELLGYIISGYQTTEAIKEFIRENRVAILWIMLTHPKFLIEKIYFSIFVHSGKHNNLRLLFIGVKPHQHIGQQLISYYESEILKEGINYYGLSVRKENKRARDFYEKAGFIIENSNFNSISYIKKLELK